MSPCPFLSKSVRALTLTSIMLTGVALSTRADVATLREKGPKSGAAFSNLGLTAMSADAKVAMRDAQVKIFLKKGEGDTLQAECEANFVLENVAPAGTEAQDYLVAFPVTGLKSKVVTVDRFAVTVDGKTPPTVFRQAIAISRRESKLEDKVIAGQLDARFASKKDTMQWGVRLADKAVYPTSYVWSQNTAAGKQSHVKVSYRVTLQPQSIHYLKSYHSSDDDAEVIPFESMDVENWDDAYYFFDYILLSGATWEGPIGKETINLIIDPELQLSANQINNSLRKPIGFRRDVAESKESGAGLEESVKGETTLRIELTNGKPWADLLLAIPVKAIGQYQPEKK